MRVALLTDDRSTASKDFVHPLTELANLFEKSRIDFRIFSPGNTNSTSWHQRHSRVQTFSPEVFPDHKEAVIVSESFRHALKTYRPSLIHMTTYGPLSLLGLNYAREQRIPATFSMPSHTAAGSSGSQGLSASYLRWFHSRCELTLVHSAQHAALLIELGIDTAQLWRPDAEAEALVLRLRQLAHNSNRAVNVPAKQPLRKAVSGEVLLRRLAAA